MDSTNNIKLLAILIGGLTFNFVFWNEELGLNLILFSAFTFAALLVTNPSVIHNRRWLLASLAHCLTCVEVVYNHMPFSILAYYATFFVMLALAHSAQVQTVLAAGCSSILQLLSSPITLFSSLANFRVGKVTVNPALRVIRFWILPTLLVFIFGGLYAQANETLRRSFADFFDVLEKISTFISVHLFADLTLGRVVFFFFGLLFSAGILLKLRKNPIIALDENGKDQLVRQRKSKKGFGLKDIITDVTGDLFTGKTALKAENTIGIYCFLSLNLLLLALNAIEITEALTIPIVNFAAELHEGTGILICSIVLALFVILYFFNGNLNFYSRNRKLKSLAIAWIIQNAVLVLMVVHKDVIYIIAHGLTEKRVGVLMFALLCGVGLTTVFNKVRYKKTFHYLVRTNSFAWLLLLVLSGFIHWEQLILDYNLDQRHQIGLDYHHTRSLSNQVLITLYENRGILANALESSRSSSKHSPESKNSYYVVKQELQERIDNFMTEHENLSKLSWNYDDWHTYHYFKSKNWRRENH